MIDKHQVKTPQIHISSAALQQLELIVAHDPTFQGKVFRINIGTKGCDGFTYSFSLSTPLEKDFALMIGDSEIKVPIHLDPFCAYYLQDGIVDYFIDDESGEDGFFVINNNQDKFRGKFWRENPELIPPQVS